MQLNQLTTHTCGDGVDQDRSKISINTDAHGGRRLVNHGYEQHVLGTTEVSF